jgi:hypothetical protein
MELQAQLEQREQMELPEQQVPLVLLELPEQMETQERPDQRVQQE